MEAHDSDYVHALNIASRPDHIEYWVRRKAENDALFDSLVSEGIEFRGYRFWPPFFCFTCGHPISASQWCFSRLCGGCDTPKGFTISCRIGASFAGKFERDLSVKDDMPPHRRFVYVHSEEGKRLIELARSMKGL